jgi:ubiquinone/menaquinone biosynthesis C-methylase UbiE
MLPSIKGINRLKALTHAWRLRGWRERTAAFLEHPGDEVTTLDLLRWYFVQSGGNVDAYDYFAFRFGQPRHLVALSFMSLVHRPQRPVLDLGCGFGHITRSLARRSGAQPAIGLDRNFFGLYVAKTRIAPEGNYVCTEASQLLPFPDRAFSALLCVDGFQLVENKAVAIQELKRVTHEDGLIMLVASRNARVQYRYARDPLPPEGYQALVADMPHRLVADNDVLSRYLQLNGPPLAHSASLECLANESLLSVVASHRREVFRDHGLFPDWPHAEGRLRLNPLFVEESPDERGKCRLRRVFPSAFYEQDNHECKRYLPEEVFVDAEVLKDVQAGKRTPAMEPLITQCVVLGMPEGY